MSPCLLLLIVLIPLIWWSWGAYYARSDRLLSEWAFNNDLTLVDSKRSKSISPGPFRFRIRGQEVYRITVKHSNDVILRGGWIRIGSFWPSLKVPAEKFEVIWDKDVNKKLRERSSFN